MKKIILGIIVGIVLLVCFVYYGGSRYLKIFGTKTEEAGEKMERVEKQLKESAKDARKSVDKTAEKVKKLVP